MHDLEELVRLKPVLFHQSAQRRAVALVVIFLQAERFVMRDLEQTDDVVADAHIDLLPKIEMMRVERVVEIEDPGRNALEGFNVVETGFMQTAGGLFSHFS